MMRIPTLFGSRLAFGAWCVLALFYFAVLYLSAGATSVIVNALIFAACFALGRMAAKATR